MQLNDQSTDSVNPELFSAFVEHTPAAVAMLDRHLRYLLTSRRWLMDYDLENQDLVGRSHYEVFPLLQSAESFVVAGELGSPSEAQGQWGLENSALPLGIKGKGGWELEDFDSSIASNSSRSPLSQSPIASPCVKRWQNIYALCLAGETQQGDSDYFIRSDGSFQKVKWEIQPWRTSTGEIGGIMMFTEFQERSALTEASLQDDEEGYRRLRETATEGIWGSASLTNTIEQLQQEIWERRQAQALLQESEERYRSLIAAMAEGIILQDATGVVRTWNAAAERILGLSAAQIRGLTAIDPGWQAITEHGEPFPKEEHPLNVTLRTGEPLTDVLMGIHKPDGTLTWTRINSQPLFRPNETTPYAAVASLIDITKRKQMGAALRESEERFRATFEQAAVGINHSEPDGRFVRVNQKFCDIVGYTREELLGQKFQDITHPDDQPLDFEYVRSLLAGEIETYSLEKRYIRKDQQFVWVQITASLVRTLHGEAKYFLSVVQDISDRKAAESALRQSEAQLREQARREGLLNRLSTQIRDSLELNRILKTTAQAIRQMLQIDRCQFAWYNPDEAQAYWEVVQEARNLDFPDLTGCYPANVVEPIAEQLLKLKIIQVDDVKTVSDPILQQFVGSLGYTSVLMIPMQTPSGTIGVISCSHSSEARPWSDSEVELLQAVTDQLLIAINQAELYAASRQATEQAQELAAQREQALYELRRTQAQLIQSEKMSSLGQLVAGVAHEINNPVNFIYGNLIYSQEYSQDLLGLVQLYRAAYLNPPSVIKERIDAIDLDFIMTDFVQLQDSMRVGAERIREIVRSLQTFSRLDESDSKEADIHSGIDSTLMILQNRLKAKPGQPVISVVKEYGELPLVECCPGQLNQVFLNLLTNAIDALEENLKSQQLQAMNKQSETAPQAPPTITITTGVFGRERLDSPRCGTGSSEIATSDSPTHIFIRIADNGPGMTQKTQQQLFDPFFTTKPVGKGTGLGLAISYQIVVEKHGGQLRCNSELGQGAEFVVEIPIKYRKPMC